MEGNNTAQDQRTASSRRPPCKFSSEDKEKFSLHDCFAESVEYNDGKLTFYFPDGIFYDDDDYDDDWPNTGEAAVTFKANHELHPSMEWEPYLYVFEEKDGLEDNAIAICKKYSAAQLAEKINSGVLELEFAYRYDGFNGKIFTCWVHSGRLCWMGELFIPAGGEIYRWNPPKEG